MGSIGILSIQAIVRNNDRKRHFEEEEILQPLENLLEINNIIRCNTRFSKSIKDKSIYVLIGNVLKQYTYKDNNIGEYIEINTIDKPEDIENIFRKYGVTISMS